MTQIKKIKHIASKTLVVFIGLVFAFSVLEVTLRLIGYADSFNRKKNDKINSDAYRISCIGNSHTYGSGAPKKMGYPEQLETFLNSKRSKPYQVINRGAGNANSSFILESLPLWLEEDRPNLVFAMVGEPNLWNRYGYWNHVQSEASNRNLLEEFEFLRWSKVYRLVELFLNRDESWNQTASERNSNTFRSLGKSNDREKALLGYAWLGALEGGASLSVGEISAEQQDEAISMLEYIYKRDGSSAAARLISEIHFEKKSSPEVILEYLERAVDLEKDFDFAVWSYAQNRLKNYFNQNERLQNIIQKMETKKKYGSMTEMEDFFDRGGKLPKKDEKEIAKFIIEISKNNMSRTRAGNDLTFLASRFYPEEALYLMIQSVGKNPLSPSSSIAQNSERIFSQHPELRQKYEPMLNQLFEKIGGDELKATLTKLSSVRNWIIGDLEKMISLSKTAGANVVIQTYPPFRNGHPREVDLWLKEWWKNKTDKQGLKFLDVGEELDLQFKSLVKDDHYSYEFGPTDNHLNEKGYALVAKLMEPLVP